MGLNHSGTFVRIPISPLVLGHVSKTPPLPTYTPTHPHTDTHTHIHTLSHTHEKKTAPDFFWSDWTIQYSFL